MNIRDIGDVTDSDEECVSLKQALEPIERVLLAVERVRSKRLLEPDVLYASVIGLFWRAVSLQEAILLLLKAGHVEEALALARSLFEDALKLHELHAAGSERTALLVTWKRDSIYQHVGLLREAAVDFDVLNENLQWLNALAAERGIRHRKRFLSPKDAALKFDRANDFLMCRLADEMVHGSEVALNWRRHRDEDGTDHFYATTSDPRIIAYVAGFAARSLMQALKATAGMLDWDPKDEFENAEAVVRAFEF